jgi:hypothetical protein
MSMSKMARPPLLWAQPPFLLRQGKTSNGPALAKVNNSQY